MTSVEKKKLQCLRCFMNQFSSNFESTIAINIVTNNRLHSTLQTLLQRTTDLLLFSFLVLVLTHRRQELEIFCNEYFVTSVDRPNL